MYLHSKIWELSNNKNIREVDLKKFLFEWRLPEKIRPLIIKEMILLGMLEKVGQYELLVNKPEFSLEDINSYYEKLGLF